MRRGSSRAHWPAFPRQSRFADAFVALIPAAHARGRLRTEHSVPSALFALPPGSAGLFPACSGPLLSFYPLHIMMWRNAQKLQMESAKDCFIPSISRQKCFKNHQRDKRDSKGKYVQLRSAFGTLEPRLACIRFYYLICPVTQIYNSSF